MATWTNQMKVLTTAYLLKEDGFYLLLETGGKIILQQSGWDTQGKNVASWTGTSKSTTSWTTQTKN